MVENRPRKVAVVLFNLGGPDGPKAVRPFLENLFSDPAIIGLPWIARRPLAALIARLRRRSAVDNYAIMGGASPLLAETRAQADALGASLQALMPEPQIKVFVGMRYWHPLVSTAAAQVAEFQPDEIILTPLYPQFSTTTTGSSLKAWQASYAGSGTVRTLCCWHQNEAFIDAHVTRIGETWTAAGRPKVRLLFSAHGLPERIVASGDPYQWQIEQTCARVAKRLGGDWEWRICYQSRVGPLRWLSPSTEEAICQAAEDGVGVLIDPIAFVSEHIETLVELDRDYAEMARNLGIKVYLRSPVVGVLPGFIDGLAETVVRSLGTLGVHPDGDACPSAYGRCPRR